MSLSGVLYRRFLRLAKTIEQNPSLKSFFTKSPVSYYNRETSEWMGFESTDITQAVPAESTTPYLGGQMYYSPFLRNENEDADFATLVRAEARRGTLSIETALQLLGYIDQLVKGGADLLQDASGSLQSLTKGLHQHDIKLDQGLFSHFGGKAEQLNIEEGDLLHAHPLLIYGVLARSVVLVAQHSDETGSVGFVLNHPTHIRLRDVVSDPVGEEVGNVFGTHTVFLGGDVEHNKLNFIHTHGELDGSTAIENVGGRLHVGGQLEDAAKLVLEGRAKASDFQFFAGYAGWGDRQLSGEVEQGSWSVIEPNAEAESGGMETPLERLVLGSAYEDIPSHCLDLPAEELAEVLLSLKSVAWAASVHRCGNTDLRAMVNDFAAFNDRFVSTVQILESFVFPETEEE
jgi:putative transcriptional regulator